MNNSVLDAEIAQFLQGFFSEIWRMFKEVTIPGTNMSALNVLVGLLFADVAITFIRKLLSNEAVGALNIGYKLGGYVDLYRANHKVKSESKHVAPSVDKPKNNQFNNFMKHDYTEKDYDSLERRKLGV